MKYNVVKNCRSFDDVNGFKLALPNRNFPDANELHFSNIFYDKRVNFFFLQGYMRLIKHVWVRNRSENL